MTNPNHCFYQFHNSLSPSLADHIFRLVPAVMKRVFLESQEWYEYLWLCLEIGNFEWATNVAQLKDVEFILTPVGWNKFQISLCITFNMRELLFIFCEVRFYLFRAGLDIFCTAYGSCEVIQYIGTDLPD